MSTPRLTARSLGRPEGVSGEDTRTRLLQIAATLFAKNGYSGVSLADIAGAAGLTAPAIYNHFPSKDELFIETACCMYDEIAAAFAEAAAPPGPWQARIVRVLHAAGQLYRDDSVLQRLGGSAQMEVTYHPERFARIQDAMENIREIFRAICGDARQAGELPQTVDPNILGDLLCSQVLYGIGSVTYQRPTHEDFEELIKAFKVVIGQDPVAGPAGQNQPATNATA